MSSQAFEPGTAEHFEEWAQKLELDSGEPFRPEKWQLEIVRDVLEKRATWTVVPQGNGKTTLMAALALYHVDPQGWGVSKPMCVIAAATRDQAGWLFLQAQNFVIDSELKNRFVCQEGFRRIKEKEGPGRIQIWAADDRNADGAIFTLAIIDELHNHKDLRLYRRWFGKLRKRDAQLLTISTAGEPGSDFEEVRAEILRKAKKRTERGAHIRAETEDIVLHDWAVRDSEKIHNMRSVKAANPLEAITTESLKRDHDDETMTVEHWKRFTCNIATRIEGEAVRPEDWEACMDEGMVPEGNCPLYGGVDLGFSQDFTAVVVLEWAERERRQIVYTKLLKPPVKQGQIAKAMVEAQKRLGAVAWAIDKAAGAQVMVQLLEDGEHPDQEGEEFTFVEYPQQNGPLADAAMRLDEAIRNHWVVHNGDPELRRHVLNAIRKPAGPGRWRYDRPTDRRRTKSPIDGLSALSFANAVAVSEQNAPKPQPALALA